MKLRISYLLILLLIFSSGKKDSDKKVLLKLRLSEGQVFKYKSVHKETIHYERYGKMQKSSHQTGYGYKFTVQNSSDDSLYNLAAVFKSAFYIGKYGSRKVEYNSSDDEDGEDYLSSAYAKSLSALIGEGFYLLLGKNYEVSELDGFSDFLDNVVIKMDGTSLSRMESYRKYLKRQYDNDGLVIFKGGIYNYPEEKVGVGDSWSYEANLSTIVKAKIKYSYTITKIKKDKIYISVNSLITPNPSGKSVKYNMKGEEKGRVIIDRHSGMVISAKITQDMSGEIKVRGRDPYAYELLREIKIKQLD